MKNRLLFLFFILFSGLFFVAESSLAAPGDAQWARSTVAASDWSYFEDVATDASANSYAVGYIDGNIQFDFGNGVTVTGTQTALNCVIVKYDANGAAQWARSAVSASGTSGFYGVATDSSGNIYAAGYLTGNGQFNFGNGVTVAGGYFGSNPVLVKYNASGVAQWARSSVVAPSRSSYKDIAIDPTGNIIVVGTVDGSDQFNFGNGVTVSGNDGGDNTVIVKYDSSGTAQWARSTVTAPYSSEFTGVSVDTSGNAYAVGTLDDNGQYDFGDGVTVFGSDNYQNAVIVKYDSSGTAQWARSTVMAPYISEFTGVSADAAGNAYAVGILYDNGQYDFGDGVTVFGADNYENAIIIKYAPDGTVQWARSTVTAPDYSEFWDIGTDPAGNAYAVGHIDSEGQFDFGNGVTVSGNYTIWDNAVVVKYAPDGTARWARSTVTAPDESFFSGVSIGRSGNISAAGVVYRSGQFDFGNSVTFSGNFSADRNAFIIQYANDDVAPPAAPQGLAVS